MHIAKTRRFTAAAYHETNVTFAATGSRDVRHWFAGAASSARPSGSVTAARHGCTLHQLGACCAAPNNCTKVSRGSGSGRNARLLARSAQARSMSPSTAQLAKPEDAGRVAVGEVDADAVIAD